MKRAVRSTFVAMILSTMLLSSGCGKKIAGTNPGSENEHELRQSTKVTEAADLVGYDGKRLRKSVDRIIDAKERRNRALEKMADGGPDQ